MRNLKKLLSVVLVVAMIAGLCAVGSFSAAAAEYSETTNYDEAAAVITGVGVMDGYEDGTMQYDKTVTREEAAAIICRALVGVDTAKKLSTAVAPFTDVAANRWSAPFINYLKSQGIVNGKTATQFDPTAEVTAVEFAKMMLCAAGYGKDNEFVGPSWDVNTITTANSFDVFKNTLATDLTAPATREQCMLYAFNAMTKVPTVSYNKTFGTYYVGTSVMNGTEGVVNSLEGNINAGNNNYRYTLAYSKFKLVTNAGAGADEYGRPATTWKIQNGKVIVDDITTGTADYTCVNGVASSALYSTLGKSVIKNLNDTIADNTKPNDNYIKVFKNGIQTGEADLFAAGPKKWAKIESDEILTNSISGFGDTVEFYVGTDDNTGDYIVTIVVINQFFGKVTKVDTAANKVTINVLRDKGGNFNIVADGEDVSISGLAKNDYVLLNIADGTDATINGTDDTVTALVKANEAKIGVFTGNDFIGQNKFDGTAYSNSAVVAALPTFELNASYKLYFDSLGSLTYAELYDDAEASTANYLYVLNAEVNVKSDTTVVSDDTYFALKVIYSDGKLATLYHALATDANGTYFKYNNQKIYLDKTSSNAATYNSTTNIEDAFKTHFYAYTLDTDNKVTLKPLNNDYAKETTRGDEISFRAGRATVGGIEKTADSNTVLTVVNKSGSVTTFKGVSNFKTATYNALSGAKNVHAFYTYNKDSGVAKTIFVYADTAVVSDAKTLGYCVMGLDTVGEKKTWMFYIDGEAKYIELDKSEYCFSGMVYEIENASGVYSVTPAAHYEDTAADNDKGMVNSGRAQFNGFIPIPEPTTPTNLVGNYNDSAMKFKTYYAWATVKTLDKNIFTTESAEKTDPEAAQVGAKVNSITYYYDANTKIYDATKGGTTELAEGAHFIAYVDETASATYNGASYCSIIWIVG